MGFTFTTTVRVPASNPGALDRYETRCSCGFVIASSLLTLAQAETSAHRAWHERRGDCLLRDAR